jgi:predicted nucleic acid-binding Zn finger protein
MVSVVMSHQYVVYIGKTDTIVVTVFLQASQTYTYVDKQRVSGCCQIVAITAAATAKGYEL